MEVENEAAWIEKKINHGVILKQGDEFFSKLFSNSSTIILFPITPDHPQVHFSFTNTKQG